MDEYLKETDYLNFSTSPVQELIEPYRKLPNKLEQAVNLYYQVRDRFIYDPYNLDLRHEALRADVILKKSRAWCVEKSIVFAAGLRAIGIPCRLGYGIVINHIGVEKLTSFLRRDEIVFHGYVDVYLNGKWIKATPAFDPLVCKLSGVPPLDWDGKSDALFQAYAGDNKFMEYVHFYGTFADVPVELMNAEMKKYYPHLFEKEYVTRRFSFRHL